MLNTIARISSVTVITLGIIVMVGWWTDAPELRSVLPGSVTMKFSTALAFVCSGAMLLCISFQNKRLRTLSAVFTGYTVLLMSLLLFGEAFGFDTTRLEQMFVVEDPAGAAFTANPGEPSIATMIAFLLLSLVGVAHVFNGDQRVMKRWAMVCVGVAVTVIGAVALVGYARREPMLFYFAEGKSSAMAIHTALGFVVCGATAVVVRPYRTTGGDPC